MKMKNNKIIKLATVVVFGIVLGCKAPALTKSFQLTYPLSIGLMMSPEYDQLNLSGNGIKVGIIDEGFKDLKNETQTKGIHIAATKNFITNNESTFFTSGSDHGMLVARNMGGKNGNETWGLAYEAAYYLAITEDEKKESKDEEYRMIKAIDWMVQQGVRVINISLTYKEFDNKNDNYTNDDLYKAKTISGKYIDSVLRNNPQINIVVSIGNDGMFRDKLLKTPADVKNVITVGSCNASGSKRAASSSIGLSSAPYIKPNVMAWPNIAGTSFAAPVIAGLIATMLQKKPSLTNVEIADILHKIGTKANNPNYEMGYGVPQTKFIMQFLN
jgi:subtilisin family serine protease